MTQKNLIFYSIFFIFGLGLGTLAGHKITLATVKEQPATVNNVVNNTFKKVKTKDGETAIAVKPSIENEISEESPAKKRRFFKR